MALFSLELSFSCCCPQTLQLFANLIHFFGGSCTALCAYCFYEICRIFSNNADSDLRCRTTSRTYWTDPLLCGWSQWLNGVGSISQVIYHTCASWFCPVWSFWHKNMHCFKQLTCYFLRSTESESADP